MVITTGVARARALAAARFATLVLACLLVAHTAIFLARDGTAAAVGPGVVVLGLPLTFGVLGAGFMVRARPRRPRRRR